MTKDTMRNVLGGFIAGSFVGALWALYLYPVPSSNKDLIVFMLGQLSGFMGAVISFNYGTTKSSAGKDELISNLATTSTNTIDTTTTTTDTTDTTNTERT